MAEFKPIFSITNTIANNLLEIERVKEGIKTLPINPALLASLRETAKLQTVHYSTQIEGNRLTQDEVKDLISKKKVVSNTGRIRDEKFSPRSARLIVLEWVNNGFLLAIGEGKKRKYQLNEKYEKIL